LHFSLTFLHLCRVLLQWSCLPSFPCYSSFSTNPKISGGPGEQAFPSVKHQKDFKWGRSAHNQQKGLQLMNKSSVQGGAFKYKWKKLQVCHVCIYSSCNFSSLDTSNVARRRWQLAASIEHYLEQGATRHGHLS
jgi:hypothetical protein